MAPVTSTVNSDVLKITQDTQCKKLTEVESLVKALEQPHIVDTTPVTLIADTHKLVTIADTSNCGVKSCSLLDELCKVDLDKAQLLCDGRDPDRSS